MATCRVRLDPEDSIAPVRARLFGTLVEHMGRCVYGGIVDVGHPEADQDGRRRDVARLTRELGTTLVRYPGGNFVSGYDWRDGIGPKDSRSPRYDPAWRSIEPNTFGLDEFMRWTETVGVEAMLAVNLGTQGAAEAVELLEYVNLQDGTDSARLRRANGRQDPYGVKLWCLGNEMDGPWQIGHRSADEYGRIAAETAAAMRKVDPSIEFVVCGSSHDRMPTLGSWETTVLEHAFDEVDYVSVHCYYEKQGDDRAGYLASAIAMDAFIESIVASCDRVAAAKGSTRRLMLSFDEWNIETRVTEDELRIPEIAPRLSEDEYNVEDAVAVGGLLISLLRHSDRVAIACLAQLVNVMAPIRAEHGAVAWRQTTFFPFALTARHARGVVLRLELHCDYLLDSPTRGAIPPVDAVALHDSEDGSFVLFAVNRDPCSAVALDIALPAGAEYEVAEHVHMGGGDPEATNSFERPERVTPVSSADHFVEGAALRAGLPPASWTMLRIREHPRFVQSQAAMS